MTFPTTIFRKFELQQISAGVSKKIGLSYVKIWPELGENWSWVRRQMSKKNPAYRTRTTHEK